MIGNIEMLQQVGQFVEEQRRLPEIGGLLREMG